MIGGMSGNGKMGFSPAEDFPPAGYADWAGAFEKASAGRAPEALARQTPDGLILPPLGAQTEDGADSGWPGQPPWTRGVHQTPAPWRIHQLHETGAPDSRSRIAEDLAHSAGAIRLVLDAPFAPVLEGLPLNGAALSLEDAAPEEAQSLAEAVKQGRIDSPGRIHFDLAASDEAARFGLAARRAPDTIFLAAGHARHEAGATPAQELGFVLESGAAALRALERAGLPPPEAAGLIRLSLAADQDCFGSIAKIRAARLVWGRVLESCGGDPHAMRLHLFTSQRMMAAEEPHTNALRVTTAAFAAACAGADDLTTRPFAAAPADGADPRRLARNTQLILQKEARLARTLDPAGGAWHVENLTRMLAEKAWALFQNAEGKKP